MKYCLSAIPVLFGVLCPPGDQDLLTAGRFLPVEPESRRTGDTETRRHGDVPASVAAEPRGAHAQDEREGFESDRSATEIYPKWEVVRDDDHPHYNEVRIADDAPNAHGGKSYLCFQSLGGSTAFQQRPRQAYPVSANRIYSLTAWTRIVPARSQERSRRNAVSIEIRWLGKNSGVLRIDRSIGVTVADDWTLLSLEIPDVPPDTVAAQVRLNFDGPDVRAECAFDDLRFSSQPRIVVELADRLLPVFRPKETAEFRIAVPSLPPGRPVLALSLRDFSGRVLSAHSASIDETGRLVERIPLPQAGYYELRIELQVGDSNLSTKTIPLIVPEPSHFPPRSGRTLSVAFNPYRERYRNVAAIAELLQLQRAKIIVWDHGTGGRSAEPESDEILSIMREAGSVEGVVFTGVLSRPPAILFPRADPRWLQVGPLSLFAQDREIWEGGLKKTIDLYREVVSDWQVGADGDVQAVLLEGAEVPFAAAARAIRGRSRTARVGVPSPPTEKAARTLADADFLAVSTEDWKSPERFLDPVAANGKERHLTGSVPLLGMGDPSAARRAQIAEFLKKLICAAAAGNQGGFTFPLAGDMRRGILDPDGYPTALALAFRVANDVLSGARIQKDRHLFADPIRDFVFEKDGETFLALWSDVAVQTQEIFLGYGAKILHPLGPAVPLESGRAFEVGPVPVFLVGVDSLLLRLQASAQLHRNTPEAPVDSTLPLRADPPSKLFRFTNPFQETLRDVQFRILDPLPPGWSIRPREDKRASLKYDETFERMLSLSFPLTEQEGVRDLFFEIAFDREISGERKRHVLRVRRAVTLVPELRILSRVTADPKDPRKRRVSIRIQNRTDRTVNLRGWIRIPGEPDRPLSVGGLRKDSEEELASFEVTSSSGFADRSVEVQLKGQGVFANKTIPLEP